MKWPPTPTAGRTLLAGSVFAAMGYWSLWALACPVLNTDSLTFNLARLWVLERGGLLHNTACTWDRFLTAPLAFDAAHYPFLYLGHAFELPSFLCFVGLLAAVYHLLQKRFGGGSGWLACLGLLGMPVMVYQAVNTKNDLVVAFGLMVWFYAMDRARRAAPREGRLDLVMAALALGLIMGSKASGAAFGLIAGAVSFASLQGPSRRTQAVTFGVAFAVLMLLFSDWEIYVVNHHRFGHWLGEPADIDAHTNLDGPRGITANLLRYLADLSDPFFVNAPTRVVLMRWKKDAVETCLRHLGLIDAGMMHMPWRPLHEDNFTRSIPGVYNENNATFGLLGMLVLWGVPLGLAWRRRWDVTAQLLAVAAVSFALVAFTVGWSPANLRYLVAPFAFGWCGLVAWLYVGGRSWMKAVLAVVALVSVVLTVGFAVSKPFDQLLTVLRSPREMLTPQQRGFVPELDALTGEGRLPVVLYAGPRAFIFDAYDRLRAGIVPVSTLDPITFERLERQYHKGQYVVLVMGRDVPADASLRPLRRFAGNRTTADTGFFLWTPPGGVSAPGG